MSLFLFTSRVLAVEYSLNGYTLTIKGDGEINQAGVYSKGNHEAFRKVIIQEGPSSIAENAFLECIKISSITIPDSVLTISQCFNRCFSLSEIIVGANNPNYTAYKNSLYTKDGKKLIRAATVNPLNILDTVETIGSYSFSVRKEFNFGNVELPSFVKTIEPGAFIETRFTALSFGKNSQLSTFGEFKWAVAYKITIPTSVTTICASGLYEGIVTELVFEEPSKLEKISSNAFQNFNIDEIKLPESVKEIEGDAFFTCTMKKITIGANCHTINETAFSGCGNLKQVIISPDNTFFTTNKGVIMSKDETQILFIDETTTSIRIPSKVTKMGITILQSATSLTEIILDDRNTYNTENGVLYSADFKNLIAVCGGVKTVQANALVTSINDFAATHSKNLESFTFNGTEVTYIGKSAFEKTNLTTFDLPSTVKTIGFAAFSGCEHLKVFNIPENSSITELGGHVLNKCPLETVFIPEFLKTLPYGFNSGSDILSNIVFHPNSQLTTIQRWSLGGKQFENLVFPASLKEIEFEAFVGCQNLKSIRFNSESKLEKIGSKAFCYCNSLVEVYLPPSCKSLDNLAFNNCPELKIVENSLTNISSGAFSNCISLDDFNFSITQTIPDPSAFQGCRSLKKFTVATGNPNIKASYGSVLNFDEDTLYLFPPGQETAYIDASTEKFADNAFAWSTKLRHVAFPTGSKLSTIGDSTFLECTALQFFQFPSQLKIIQSNSFNGCSSLKKITLPESITKIGENAFANCAKLKYVKYCGSNKVTGSNVFSNSVIVGVNEYYKFETLCSVKVKKELTVDCELMVPKVSCQMRNNFSFGGFLLTTMFLLE